MEEPAGIADSGTASTADEPGTREWSGPGPVKRAAGFAVETLPLVPAAQSMRPPVTWDWLGTSE